MIMDDFIITKQFFGPFLIAIDKRTKMSSNYNQKVFYIFYKQKLITFEYNGR